MITEQWLQANAAVVPDNAYMFVRHPRHFIIRIDRIGWTRFTADDAAEIIPLLLNSGAEGGRRDFKAVFAKANPERIVEHSCSATRLLSDQDLHTKFRTCFGSDESIPASLDLIKQAFPEAKQVIVLLPGGASWFIWGLKEGVL